MRKYLMSLMLGLFTPLAGAQTPLLDLYQWFHSNPELSFQEKSTAARMASELRAAGLEVTTGVGGHGLVALLNNGTGPVVMLRADMDGLPVKEMTELTYASKATAIEQTGKAVSVMHACGHDVHMAALIGAVRDLVATRTHWSGTLVVIGQPAEERGAGARAMLKDGLFERFPRPHYNLALHTYPSLPAGSVGYRAGYAMANVDSVDITVRGIGTHGAAPELGKDPVVIASSIVMALQTLVSREISPSQPGVITVGSFHAGSKHNIISNRAHLQLTVRSYSQDVRAKLLNGIKRVALNQARSFGIANDSLPLVSIKDESTPALWNDPQLVERLLPLFRSTLGAGNVVQIPASMGGEDFAHYGQIEPRIPSFLFRLGTAQQDEYEAFKRGELSLPSLHSPLYRPAPQLSISTGTTLLAEAATQLFNAK